MYKVTKRMEIAGSHQLQLNYESKCENLHGHNWIITVEISGKELNKNGMLADFTRIKELIHDELDHKNLNEVFDFNPTAENIAKWVGDILNIYFRNDKFSIYCSRVQVQESEGNIAEWSIY